MVLERCLVLFIRAASEVYSRSLSGSNLHGVQQPSVAIAMLEDTCAVEMCCRG